MKVVIDTFSVAPVAALVSFIARCVVDLMDRLTSCTQLAPWRGGQASPSARLAC